MSPTPAIDPITSPTKPPPIIWQVSGSRFARRDPRWPLIQAALRTLIDERRRAIRIVDADCACGTLLIETAREARMLGFVAIEGRGINGAPAMIGRARAASRRLRDPAIDLTFDCADKLTALASEIELPADIILCRRTDDCPALSALLRAAGDRVIGEFDEIDAMRMDMAA